MHTPPRAHSPAIPPSPNAKATPWQLAVHAIPNQPNYVGQKAEPKPSTSAPSTESPKQSTIHTCEAGVLELVAEEEARLPYTRGAEHSNTGIEPESKTATQACMAMSPRANHSESGRS